METGELIATTIEFLFLVAVVVSVLNWMSGKWGSR